MKAVLTTTFLAAFPVVLASAAELPHGKSAARKSAVDQALASEAESLETFYKQLHAQPELSQQEIRTAARLAEGLKSLGFEVTTGVGGDKCPGVVGVFKNGNGPIVLVRTDMDALPVTEKTGLPYASQVRARDKEGNEVGVMHACGHDMHMTCWLGAARVLTALKTQWAGTLVFIGQPAEETGVGARLMLADGLFKKFPKPDYALALHCDSRLPVGYISYTDGLALANVDTVDILVRGKGGHGAAPHSTVDPVVLAARIVLDLQTIASREVNPLDPVVVTVGSIHGGTKHNIIPNEVKLQLTVRTTRDEVRKQVLDAIDRIAKAAAAGARAPVPVVTVDQSEFTPALVNESKLTKRTTAVFRAAFGEEQVRERPLIMGGEDFGRYGRDGVPIFMWFIGTVSTERYAESLREGGRPLPSMHSDTYAPDPAPSLKLGVTSLSLAVLELLGK